MMSIKQLFWSAKKRIIARKTNLALLDLKIALSSKSIDIIRRRYYYNRLFIPSDIAKFFDGALQNRCLTEMSDAVKLYKNYVIKHYT